MKMNLHGFISIIKSLHCLIFLWLFIIPMICYTEYPDMEMNATPNPVGSGARAMGMGGAFISIADDATAASWNPAGLLQVLKPEVSIVGSWFSGKYNFETSGIDGGDIGDESTDITHLNYLSFLLPCDIFRRNIVFSVNYQHLYEFSKDTSYSYIGYGGAPVEGKKQQNGSLSALSPALAFEITPSLYIGLTANFWPDDILDNGWENINRSESIESNGKEVVRHMKIYEEYRFSGFNMHLGFLYRSDLFTLWGKKRRFRIGGVVKTPFDASIQHKYREISYTIDPNNVFSFDDTPPYFPSLENLSLEMPISYGLGFSLVFSDTFSMGLDVYHTRWDQYLMKYPSGRKLSPINKKPEETPNIKPTTQIRLGGVYHIHKPMKIISLRCGVFYDPEPAQERPDDFYGASLGAGITYDERISFDIMYQFRFGEKRNDESIMGKDVSSRVNQHYIYVSAIYYLFR